MKDPIYESIAKIRDIESIPQTEGVLSKIGSKIIPGAGAAFGAYDAAKRLKAGDKIGAGISGATAGLSSVPIIGTAAALLGTGAQAAWDKYKTGSWFPDDDEIAKGAAEQPDGKDPKVLALQQKLIAKGAKITADGKMGPATQAAMKQFPDVKMSEDNEENKMSESQKIAELINRLAQLEQVPAQEQLADEGIADIAKGAWQGVKNVGQSVKNTFQGTKDFAKGATASGADASRVAAGAPGVTKAMQAGQNAAGKVAGATQAVKGQAGNIAKVGGGAAAGAVAATALQGDGAATKPDTGAATKPATGAATKPATGAAAGAGLSPAEMSELATLDKELAQFMGQDPALDDLLLKYQQMQSK